jgi:RNA polymerase sigma-70 factor, ECF subfamily
MDTPNYIRECSLIREAQAGNHAAFAQLVHAHDEALLRLAFRITGSHCDSQDIYQEVFLKVYRKLNCFRFECSFSTWLSRIVTNACLDHLRKSRVRRENSTISVDIEGEKHDLLDQISDDRYAHNPEKEYLRSEMSTGILCALQQLTPHERNVFDLKHFQGMTVRAISEALDMPEKSVKISCVRATRKLRLQLAQIYKPAKTFEHVTHSGAGPASDGDPDYRKGAYCNNGVAAT